MSFRFQIAALSLGLTIAFCCSQSAFAQEVVVQGKKFMNCGGKLYPMIRSDWTSLDGKVHESWVTDYSSWVAPKTKPMNLPDPKPINVPSSDFRATANEETRPPIIVKDQGTKHYITLNADVLFDFNKFTLNEKATKVMDKLGPIIQQYGACSVSITGHTDSIGSDEYNQTLSEKRSESVKDWLMSHQFVSDSVSTCGAGKKHPIAPNTYLDGSDCPVGRARNRRVEIVVDTAVTVSPATDATTPRNATAPSTAEPSS